MLKHRAGLLLLLPVLGLMFASSASAAPKGIFSIFSDCPTTEPGVVLCSYSETTSGEFAIGSTKVPINKPIILQGGAVAAGEEETADEYALVPATDGNSLSKTELNVPGGLTDLVNCEEIKGNGLLEKLERGTCKAIFENKTTGVTATTELVANAHNPAFLSLFNIGQESGTGITLPIRVHLKNPLLGNGCYVGSEASPIQLHLTTGATSPPAPNKSIHGTSGTLEGPTEKGLSLIRLKNASLVDNAFSVPVAEGCGGLFSFLLDPIVNSKLGLPSAAGHNTAILNGTLNTASVRNVVASEKF
jgi:hypothetical protein